MILVYLLVSTKYCKIELEVFPIRELFHQALPRNHVKEVNNWTSENEK